MPVLTSSGTPTFTGSVCTIDETGEDGFTAPSSLLSVTQGWVAVRMHMGWATAAPPVANRTIVDWQESTALTNWIWCQIEPSTGTFRMTHGNSGDQNFSTSAFTWAIGDPFTVVYKWDASFLGIAVNGAAFATTARTRFPVNLRSIFEIGFLNGIVGRQPNSDVYWLAAGTGVLVDSDSTLLNGFGDTDPAFERLPGTPTFLWKAKTVDYEVATPPGAATPRGIAESPPVLWNAPQRPEFPQASPPPAWNNASD